MCWRVLEYIVHKEVGPLPEPGDVDRNSEATRKVISGNR